MRKKVVAGTGEKAPESGIYQFSGRKTQIAISKNDRVPPNKKGHRQQVVLVRRTRGGN